MPEAAAQQPYKAPTRRRIGPYSRPPVLTRMDMRSREAAVLREARAELTDHVGGKPNAVQRRLIERAAMLALRLALMDAKEPDGTLSERDSREYLAWHNSYVRTLAALGMQAAAQRPPALADLLRQPAQGTPSAPASARAATSVGPEAAKAPGAAAGAV